MFRECKLSKSNHSWYLIVTVFKLAGTSTVDSSPAPKDSQGKGWKAGVPSPGQALGPHSRPRV